MVWPVRSTKHFDKYQANGCSMAVAAADQKPATNKDLEVKTLMDREK
jgi:hypothetical protein